MAAFDALTLSTMTRKADRLVRKRLEVHIAPAGALGPRVWSGVLGRCFEATLTVNSFHENAIQSPGLTLASTGSIRPASRRRPQPWPSGARRECSPLTPFDYLPEGPGERGASRSGLNCGPSGARARQPSERRLSSSGEEIHTSNI